jgi:hypothetical protein
MLEGEDLSQIGKPSNTRSKLVLSRGQYRRDFTTKTTYSDEGITMEASKIFGVSQFAIELLDLGFPIRSLCCTTIGVTIGVAVGVAIEEGLLRHDDKSQIRDKIG